MESSVCAFDSFNLSTRLNSAQIASTELTMLKVDIVAASVGASSDCFSDKLGTKNTPDAKAPSMTKCFPSISFLREDN